MTLQEEFEAKRIQDLNKELTHSNHAPNYFDDPNICLTCEQEREVERLTEDAGISRTKLEHHDEGRNGK